MKKIHQYLPLLIPKSLDFYIFSFYYVRRRRWTYHQKIRLSARKVCFPISLHFHFYQMGAYSWQLLRTSHIRKNKKYEKIILELGLKDSSIHIYCLGILLCKIQLLPKFNQLTLKRGRVENTWCFVHEKIFVIQT